MKQKKEFILGLIGGILLLGRIFMDLFMGKPPFYWDVVLLSLAVIGIVGAVLAKKNPEAGGPLMILSSGLVFAVDLTRGALLFLMIPPLFLIWESPVVVLFIAGWVASKKIERKNTWGLIGGLAIFFLILINISAIHLGNALSGKEVYGGRNEFLMFSISLVVSVIGIIGAILSRKKSKIGGWLMITSSIFIIIEIITMKAWGTGEILIILPTIVLLITGIIVLFGKE